MRSITQWWVLLVCCVRLQFRRGTRHLAVRTSRNREGLVGWEEGVCVFV